MNENHNKWLWVKYVNLFCEILEVRSQFNSNPIGVDSVLCMWFEQIHLFTETLSDIFFLYLNWCKFMYRFGLNVYFGHKCVAINERNNYVYILNKPIRLYE